MTVATSSSDRYAEARAALAEYDATAEAYRDGMGYGLASALRALITPPATEETVEQITDRLVDAYADDTYHGDELQMVRGVIEDAARAGIQAAWESWEPENAPGMVDTRETPHISVSD